MKRKHYLIYGHGGSYNHGGEAITRCTIDFLRKVSKDCFITLSTHFPEQDLEFGLDVDEMVTRDLSQKRNEEIYRTTLASVTPDTVAIHVGGDNYCYPNWERYALIHKEVKKKGGTSIFWGCSIDKGQVNEEMLTVLREHDLILARECITFRTLKELGLRNVLQVSDIAFSMVPEAIEFSWCNYVVVNLSPLVCRKNPAVLHGVQKLIETILDETEYSIVLVPHVMMSVDNDYEVLSQIYKKYDSSRVMLLSDKLSAQRYKYVISKARFCIAARTHVTIAAYSSCVPTIAIGYSTKARGIAEDLGMSEFVIDIMDKNIEATLCTGWNNMMKKEEETKQKLIDQIESYKRNALPQVVVAFVKGE